MQGDNIVVSNYDINSRRACSELPMYADVWWCCCQCRRIANVSIMSPFLMSTLYHFLSLSCARRICVNIKRLPIPCSSPCLDPLRLQGLLYNHKKISLTAMNCLMPPRRTMVDVRLQGQPVNTTKASSPILFSTDLCSKFLKSRCISRSSMSENC